MPIPTPFHPCSSRHCVTQEWHNWAGYLAAGTYEPSYEREYFSIRNAAALIDISPLYKYDIQGPDAVRLLNRVLPRDVRTCAVGQVLYSPWCDDHGKVIDDGTFQRLGENHFRATAADPNLYWFEDCALGMEVQITDVSEAIGALALQGPNARAILQALSADPQVGTLPYYGLAGLQLAGLPVVLSRTGYTGDLGYEIWVPADKAPQLWDALMGVGIDFGLAPAGLAALDMARIEAGLLLIEVDYISAHKAVLESRKSSPYEIGLGWTVDLEKGPFVGRRALLAERAAGPQWKFVGLEVPWPALEALFDEVDLPPQVAGRASRASVPLYHRYRQVGQVTSSTFSPILKKYIALGTVEAAFGELGDLLEMEITVEYERKQAPATVVRRPFYNPAHKKSGP